MIFICSRSLETVFPKWRYTGTSKSRGIDLVAREKSENEWNLILYESKHIHDEIRNSENKSTIFMLRNKFENGIEEFESKKTKLNLASILIHLGDFIRIGEATGTDVSLIKDYWKLISESLKSNRYSLVVVILADDKYCNNTEHIQHMYEVSSSLKDKGNHILTLTLIESKYLEKMTDEMCCDYVGSI